MIKIITHTPRKLVLTQGKFSLAIKGTLFCLPFALWLIFAAFDSTHSEMLECQRFASDSIQCQFSQFSLLGVRKSSTFDLQIVEVSNQPNKDKNSEDYALVLTANNPQYYPQDPDLSLERSQAEQYKRQIDSFIANADLPTIAIQETADTSLYFWLGFSFLGGILGLYQSWWGKLISTMVFDRDTKLVKIQQRSALGQLEKRSLSFEEIAEVIVKYKSGGDGNINSRLILKLKSQESLEPFDKLFVYTDNEEEIAKLIRQFLNLDLA